MVMYTHRSLVARVKQTVRENYWNCAEKLGIRSKDSGELVEYGRTSSGA